MGAASPAGGCSVALSLAGAVTGGGGWAAAVGMPWLGLVAAEELGVDLARFAVVPEPGGQWAVVVAALLDGFDLVLVHPPARVQGTDARRLAARARERGSVLVVMDAHAWPETPDLHLAVVASAWEGLGSGHGALRSRRIEVSSGGRRAAGRERRVSVWLPGPGGWDPGGCGPGGWDPGGWVRMGVAGR